MIITEVEAYTVVIPLEKPISVADFTVTARDYVVVRIQTDEGIEGRGFGLGRNGLIPAFIEHNLKSLLLRKDPLCTEGLWQNMYSKTRFLGRKGILMRAISAIDIALWDIKGKKANLPLWKLVGGASNYVPAFVAGGYYREGNTLEEIRNEYAGYREAGYKGAKMMLGRLSLKEDLKRVEAARVGLGDEPDLMVDFGGLLPNAKTAMKFIRAMEEWNVTMVEDPFLLENAPALRELTRLSPIPISIGEDESGRWAFREILQQQLADVLRLDATVIGGISEWMKIASLSMCFENPLFPHWFPEVHIHLAAAVPNCLGIEMIPAESGIMGFDRLLRNPVVAVDGVVKAPEAPGLGLEWDDDFIRKYRD